MKKKLSLLLAVVFIMTLAFGILPTAGAEQAPNHDADRLPVTLGMHGYRPNL